jgi:alpha-D-ribose 1-methylphosphonate 5-phosphate C-P lyase
MLIRTGESRYVRYYERLEAFAKLATSYMYPVLLDEAAMVRHQRRERA